MLQEIVSVWSKIKKPLPCTRWSNVSVKWPHDHIDVSMAPMDADNEGAVIETASISADVGAFKSASPPPPPLLLFRPFLVREYPAAVAGRKLSLVGFSYMTHDV